MVRVRPLSTICDHLYDPVAAFSDDSAALSRLPVDDRFQGIAVEQIRLVTAELETVAVDFDAEFQGRVGPRRGFVENNGGHRAA